MHCSLRGVQETSRIRGDEGALREGPIGAIDSTGNSITKTEEKCLELRLRPHRKFLLKFRYFPLCGDAFEEDAEYILQNWAKGVDLLPRKRNRFSMVELVGGFGARR